MTLRIRRKRSGKCVEAELAIQIAASAGVKFVETGDGAHDPARIDGFGECFEFLCQRNVSQDGMLHARGELEEIGEQAVEDVDLVFKGGVAVLGEGRGGGEKLREALAARGTLEDMESVAAALGGFFDIHFDGQAGAAFGELRGEL